MAKTIKIEHFEIQNVKVSKKSIHLEYWDTANKNDLNTVDSDSAPHEDLTNTLKSLNEVFAESLGLLDGWNHARDHIKANDEALKKAVIGYKSEIDRCIVSEVTLVGSGDNCGIKLKGELQTDFGNVKLPSGIILYSDTIGENAKEIIAKLTNEVYLFLFKGKRDNDLFNQKGGEGLGNSEPTLKTA